MFPNNFPGGVGNLAGDLSEAVELEIIGRERNDGVWEVGAGGHCEWVSMTGDREAEEREQVLGSGETDGESVEDGNGDRRGLGEGDGFGNLGEHLGRLMRRERERRDTDGVVETEETRDS